MRAALTPRRRTLAVLRICGRGRRWSHRPKSAAFGHLNISVLLPLSSSLTWHQPVEFVGILACNFALDHFRQVTELPVNVILGVGKHTVGVRIVGSPHNVLHP